jgi:hypothetical protein
MSSLDLLNVRFVGVTHYQINKHEAFFSYEFLQPYERFESSVCNTLTKF